MIWKTDYTEDDRYYLQYLLFNHITILELIRIGGDNIVVTKEMIIKQLTETEDISATSIRHLYNGLERIIFDRLSSTSPTENTVVKLFEGISINCNYNDEEVIRHPSTGKQVTTPSKIWAKASITRNYNRKLNKIT